MKTAIALHGRTVPNNNLSSVNASPPPTLVMVEMSPRLRELREADHVRALLGADIGG
jgi:hypothetical protein